MYVLQELFVKRFKEKPESLALINGDRSFTYGELYELSNRLGRHLKSLGTEPNQLVGIVMNKGWEQIVSCLGILNSGAAYLPIDSKLPNAGIQELLEQGQVSIVLTQSHIKSRLLGLSYIKGLNKQQIIEVDKAEEGLLHQYEALALPYSQSIDDLAYVIFTSGSTGKPKGVMVDHKAVVNTILDINNRYKINSDDRVLGLSSLSFDLSVYDIFGILGAGGTIVLPEEEFIKEPIYWVDLIEKHRVTVWNTVPMFMQMLVEAAQDPNFRNMGERVGSLRWVLMSGDWIPVDLPQRIRTLFNEVGEKPPELVSLGGATEASIWSIEYRIGEVNPAWKSIPYGKALRNQSFYVLNEELETSPEWVVGDLYIGGIGLARGYWRDEEKTNEKFIRHERLGRLYRTGDLGRYLPDGNIEFLGRIDDQVKVRGYRIELGEIEYHLRNCIQVKEASINAFKQDNVPFLVAYIVPEEKASHRNNPDLLKNPLEKMEFKLSQKGIRKTQYNDKTINLPPLNKEMERSFFARKSYRLFQKHTVSKNQLLSLFFNTFLHRQVDQTQFSKAFSSVSQLDQLCGLLQSLSALAIRNQPLPKYRYPSAGGLYPVQIYIYIDSCIEEGVEPGYYYFNQINHQLHSISNKSHKFPFSKNNEPLLCSIHLAGKLSAIRPIYGFLSEDFCVLEAGYIQGLLEFESKNRGLYISTTSYTGNKKIELKHNLSLEEDTFLISSIGIKKKTKNTDKEKNIKILLFIKDNFCSDLTMGWYELDLLQGTCQSLNINEFNIDCLPDENYSIYENGGCVVFFLAPRKLSSDQERNEYLIEVGRFSQLLMEKGPSNGVGFCSVGSVDLEKLGNLHKIWEKYCVTHCLLSGSINTQQIESFSSEDIKKNTSKLSLELKKQLSQYLPEYMIPSYYVELERLPLNANGKVDKKALPAPEREEGRNREESVGPRNEVEEKLAAIWCEVLGLNQVSIHDNFFQIGGHSLLAIQMASHVKTAFGVNFPLREIFLRPIFESFAKFTGELHKVHDETHFKLPAIIPDPQNRFKEFPLTDIQQAYWIGRGGDLELGNVAVHGYSEFDHEELDVDRLEQAWNRLIERHEALRLIFPGNGYQKILSEVPYYKFLRRDYGKLPSEVREEKIQKVREELSHEVMPAEKWPLFNISVTYFPEKVRLHLSFDALILDGWSFDILFEEWKQLYNNIEEPLPPLDVSFRDYVLAEYNLRTTPLYEKDRSYWMKRLEKFPGGPDLPLLKSPHELEEQKFSRCSKRIDRETWEVLQRESEKHLLTPTSLLTAVFAEILSRWSRTSHFVINLTLFNRLPLHPHINQIIGDFTSLVLLEVPSRLEEKEKKFLYRAKALQERLWEDIDHRLFSGIEVQRELLRRSYNTRALMPIVFTCVLGREQEKKREENCSSLLFKKEEYGITQTPQVWLDYRAYEVEGSLVIEWDYVESLFPSGLIDEMHNSYYNLLLKLSENNASWSQPASQLISVPQVSVSNVAEINEFSSCLLQELFVKRFKEKPESLALINGDRSFTYGELYELSNRLGRHLKSLGTEPNQLVGIVMNKGWEQIVSCLGILNSGAAYLPIDSKLPNAGIQELLEQGQVSIVLTQSHIKSRLLGLSYIKGLNKQQIIEVDKAEEGLLHQYEALALPYSQSIDDLAYVIFTSGSTGKPKGVMVDHKAVVNTILDINNRYKINSDDRVLGLSSLSFDLSVYDIFGILGAGGTIVLPEEEFIKEPIYWVDLIEKHRVTVWNTVPMFMQMLVEAAQDPNFRNMGERVGSLRWVLMSGDWIPVDLPQRIRTLFNEVGEKPPELVSLGGATEASIWSIEYRIGEVNPAWKSIPYGKALRNQSFYVLNEELETSPEWVVGDLYIGGIGLARGYWRDEEKTNEKFIRHERLGRLYRTGDLGRYLPDGNIEFLGRIDDQVKVRGYRIELGEIESVISQYPDVTQCVVVAREEGNSKHLVGYIVRKDQGETEVNWSAFEETIRSHISQFLPEYMIPSYYVELERLPLNANGKVDKKALPAPEREEESYREEYVGPRNEIEEKLSAIWCEVLGLKQVSIQDNFFQIGGDSILSIQVISRMNQLGLKLSIAHIFQNPIIASLSKIVEAQQIKTKAPIPSRVLGDVALTPIQHWFFEQSLKNPHYFNQAVLLEASCLLEFDHVNKVLQNLCQHDSTFHLRFKHHAEGWTQFYQLEPSAAHHYLLKSYDLSSYQDKDFDKALKKHCEELQSSLNIEQGPIMAVGLFKDSSEQRHYLFMTIHHLLIDGISWRVLLDNFKIRLKQISSGEDVKLPSLTNSYGDWSEALIEYSKSEGLKEQKSYWQKILHETNQALPVDFKARKGTIAEAQEIVNSLSVQETKDLLQNINRAYGTQINDILLSALVLAIEKWTGNSQMTLWLEGHGREDINEEIDISRTLGWFTSLFPVHLSVADPHNLGNTIKAVKENLRAIPQHGIGFGVLKYVGKQLEAPVLNLEEKSQISFNYLGQWSLEKEGDFRFSTKDIGKSLSPDNELEYGLNVISEVKDNCFTVYWLYSSCQYKKETIDRIAKSYIDFLRALIAHCTSITDTQYTPSDFPLCRLTQKPLDEIVKNKRIEDLYPLSPMQAGLLFRSLYEPEETELYVVQGVYEILGDLNGKLLHQAWEKIVENTPVLRTAFYWEDVDDPLQYVCSSIEVSWQEEDWRTLSIEDQEKKLTSLLETDRKRGFNLAEPPLFRLYLIKLEENRYYLIWSQHHILLDGWSGPLIINDLLNFYAQVKRGHSINSSERFSYKEYISWLKNQDEIPLKEYWSEYLSGFEEPTWIRRKKEIVLKDDKRKEGKHSRRSEYEIYSFSLSSLMTDEVSTFAQRHRLTLNTVVQGVWSLLLKSYTQHEDVMFGTTLSGRSIPLPGVESGVGLFINTLPLRVQFKGGETVLELLNSLQERMISITEHGYASLAQIQAWQNNSERETRRENSGEGINFFDTIYVFENYPIQSPVKSEKTDFEMKSVWGRERTEYPLTIAVNPGEELTFRFMYEKDHFERGDIERIGEYLERLLHQIVESPEGSIEDLKLLTSGEREEILHRWNETSVDYPRDVLLMPLFEEQVLKRPASKAVVYEGEFLTYTELNKRSNQLAHYLRSLGVGPESLVAISMERSLEMVVGLLGILKSGGAYVPLDASYPEDRLQFMLKDTNAKILITQDKLKEKYTGYEGKIIHLNSDWDEISKENEDNPPSINKPSDLAYVIYTSGSTGLPKGVMIQHNNLLNYLRWCCDNYLFEEGNGVVLHSSIAFDMSITDLYPPLIKGKCLYITKEEYGPDSLIHVLNDNIKYSFIKITPTHIKLFKETIKAEEIYQNISRIIIGGESLSRNDISELSQIFPNAIYINEYGPTETTVGCSIFTFPKNDTSLKSLGNSIPIGHPISNTQIYILDDRMEPVSNGMKGEIYIGGEGVARGYLNRPELTNEKFIKNPFSKDSAARLYRTGDLGWYLPDGNIEFLGRIDDQVKIRGYRIELGEIESVISQHPDVSHCAVVVKESDNATKYLVAYIVCGEFMSSPTELKSFLSEKLPNHMVPSIFQIIEKMPLTVNGKVNRNILLSIEQNKENGFEEVIEPLTELEKSLFLIWKDVLRNENFGVHDNFFQIGGHSLLAAQIISRVRNNLGYDIPFKLLFENPTIKLLCKGIEKIKGNKDLIESRVTAVSKEGEKIPLSYAQRRIWFMEKLFPNIPLYNIPLAFTIQGHLDMTSFMKAFFLLVKKHAVLRTKFFDNDNSEPYQVVIGDIKIKSNLHLIRNLRHNEKVNLFQIEGMIGVSQSCFLKVDYVDLRSFSMENWEQELGKRLHISSHEIINISDDPLVQASLYHLEEDKYVLSIKIHHIIFDAGSSPLFLNDLGLFYNLYLKKEETPDLTLPVQYSDFILWQHKLLTGEYLIKKLDFWREFIGDGSSYFSLSLDKTRPSQLDFSGKEHCFKVDKQLALKVRKLAQKNNLSVYILLLSSFKILLYKYTNEKEFIIGSPSSPRQSEEIEKVIGLFLNILPLKSTFKEGMNFESFLQLTRNHVLEAYEHQDIPFEQLVDYLGIERNLQYNPLFQILFAFYESTPNLSLNDLRIESCETNYEISKYDLTLYAHESNDEIHFTFEYATHLFCYDFIKKLASHFIHLLHQIVESPEGSIEDLKLLTSGEREEILHRWNETSVDYPRDVLLMPLFEEQVLKRPASKAVVYEGEFLTYTELNKRSNQLAHYLRSLGVGPESLVAISMERSLEMVVGLLGILKSGGAYVPLDASYPEDRLQFMLKDTNAKILITQDKLKEKYTGYEGKIIHLNSDWDEISKENEDNPPSINKPSDLAYVIYTSGSTGLPKGVMIQHNNLLNTLISFSQKINFTPQDRQLAVTTIGFDISVLEIFMPLLQGGGVVIASQEDLMDTYKLIELTERSGATVLQATPSLWHLIIQGLGEKKLNIRGLCGGEELTSTLAEVITLKVDKYWNVYGPTETTIWSTIKEVLPEDGCISIGHPISNTQIYILDDRMEPAPNGMKGEIYIGGEGVARGYLNRAELTKEKFIKNPFSKDSAARLYRSGDLGRYLPDGNIEFLGRIDDQVKIRGYRIELGEIESVISQHPDVTQCVVVAREEGNSKHLVGYIVRKDQGETEVNWHVFKETIRSHISQYLPEYMIPSYYVELERLPLNANGKVDKKALPAPEREEGRNREESVGPRNEVEEKLAAIWCEVLGLNQVSIHDNFFQIGGHSLLIVQVHKMIESLLGFKLSIVDLFKYPKINTLSDFLTENLDNNELEEAKMIANRRKTFFLNTNRR